MTTIRYDILFIIKLEHDYYANEPFGDIQIIPSNDTSNLFKDLKLIYRLDENVFTVLVETKDSKPVIMFNDLTLFRFYLVLNNSSFLNFSSLKIRGNANKVYYFSNKSDNERKGELHLSSPVPVYSNSDTYEQGAIVSKTSRVFECIQGNSNIEPHATTDVLFWRDIVTHKSKLLPVYLDTKTYQIGDEVKEGQKVFECIQANSPSDKHNASDALFWQEIKEAAYVTQSDLVDKGTIATKTIAAYNSDVNYVEKSWTTAGGKFFEAVKPSSKSNLHATNDAAFWKEISADYILDKSDFSLPPKTFAVVDVFNGFGESEDYALLTSGEVTGKKYSIRFKNRSTTWKFISQKNQVSAISDTSGVYNFSHAAGSNDFISAEPIPLNKRPLTSIRLNATVNARSVELNGLQNPGVDFIKLSGNTSDYKVFSEVYLNY